MSKKIEFEYEGEKFTLEYNRRAVQLLEEKGFEISQFEAKPMTNIPLLFQYSFAMHHPEITMGKIDLIYNTIEDKKGLATQLYGMVADAYNSLFEESEDKDAKKTSWKVV